MKSTEDRFLKFEEIIHQFYDNEIVSLPEPFGSGHINDTFLFSVKIDQEPEAFILQKINSGVFRNPEAVMENIQTVAVHLLENDYPKKVLEPVLTRKNQPFFKSDYESYWRVFPFFKNTFTVDSVENEDQAYEAASAFGEYLNCLRNLDSRRVKTTIPDFHDGILRTTKLKQVLKTASEKRLKEANREIDFIEQHLSLFRKIAGLDLPTRITHNDTKINNILFDKNSQKPMAIIDLDTLMPGVVLSDYGDMVRTFTNSGEEDEPDLSLVEMRKEILEAVNAGFLEQMPVLTKTERIHLFEGAKWIVLMQAVRFLTDFLEDDVYYKTKYAGHNLVRTRNQIKLFKSMN